MLLFINLMFYTWGVWLIVGGDLGAPTLLMTFFNLMAVLISAGANRVKKPNG